MVALTRMLVYVAWSDSVDDVGRTQLPFAFLQKDQHGLVQQIRAQHLFLLPRPRRGHPVELAGLRVAHVVQPHRAYHGRLPRVRLHRDHVLEHVQAHHARLVAPNLQYPAQLVAALVSGGGVAPEPDRLVQVGVRPGSLALADVEDGGQEGAPGVLRGELVGAAGQVGGDARVQQEVGEAGLAQALAPLARRVSRGELDRDGILEVAVRRRVPVPVRAGQRPLQLGRVFCKWNVFFLISLSLHQC